MLTQFDKSVKSELFSGPISLQTWQQNALLVIALHNITYRHPTYRQNDITCQCLPKSLQIAAAKRESLSDTSVVQVWLDLGS